MMGFLSENLSTIVITLILIIVVALIVRGMIRDKKAGKLCSGCSGGCGGCSGCHTAPAVHQTKSEKKKGLGGNPSRL